MNRHFKRFSAPSFANASGLLLAVVVMMTAPLLATTANFTVPDDTALRIRLDDTLTSNDSQVGDPFSATVVDKGDYRNARVYGHVSEIDMSGKIKGHTSMMLRFDRLVMPDGRAPQFTPKSLSSITPLQARRSMWKARSSQVAVAARRSSIPRSEPVPAPCWAEFLAEVRELESDPSSAASAVSGRRHFMDIRRSRSTVGRKS